MGRMTLHKWYGRSIRVPEPGSYYYDTFVSSCIGLVRSIVEDHIGKVVRVRFMSGGTAAANREESLIHLNEEFLKGHIPDARTKQDGDTTTTVILGVIVHEAAHFAWSPTTLEPFINHVKDNTKVTFVPEVAGVLGNV